MSSDQLKMDNNKKKRISETIDKDVSVPWQVYFILLVISFVLIYLAIFWISQLSIWNGITINIGYGVFCSTSVALLIDIGSTRRLIKRNKIIFESLKLDLRDNCQTLLYIRWKYKDIVGEKYNNKSYLSWLKKASSIYTISGDSDNKVLVVFEELKQVYREIKASAEALKIGFYSNLENEAVTYKNRTIVSSIVLLCDVALRAADDKDYEKFFLASKELFLAIGYLYPEYSNELTVDSSNKKLVESEAVNNEIHNEATRMVSSNL